MIQSIASNDTQVDDAKESSNKGTSSPTRVLLADKLGPFVAETLTDKYQCAVTSDPSLKEDALVEKLKEIQPAVLVVRSTKVKLEHLEAAKTNLALIVRAGAGVNTIDCESASKMGIFVANCPGKNAIAVAELTIGALINLDRRISDNVESLRNGKWMKGEFGKARGLAGRTLAVIGVGNIGREVCSRALAFGMTVRGYSRSLTAEQCQTMGIQHCQSVAEAVDGADALSLHLPKNDSTTHIVNEEILSKMNDGAYVVNCSRGGVVDEKAMMKCIESKGMRYAPDVYEDEPKGSTAEFTDKAIMSNPSIYGTHHIGASTQQASDAVGAEVLRVIGRFMGVGEVVNCVNLETKSPAQFVIKVRHNDVVGVLAAVLTILKKENVNVQDMSNVVFKGAKSACATLQVDHGPSDQAIAELKALDTVYGVELTQI